MDFFGKRRRQIAALKVWAEGRAIHFEGLDRIDSERLAPIDGLLRGKRS